MKRIAFTLIVLLAATSLFAGGKECNLKSAAKSVSLTGTLAQTGSGDAAKTTFRVANSNTTYTVCGESTKAEFLKLSGNVRVQGKVVNCSGNEELVITSARKI